MLPGTLRILLVLATAGFLSARGHAQAPPQTVQPGLETAVKWKWWVLPSAEKDWGFPLIEPVRQPDAAPKSEPGADKRNAALQKAMSITPGNYEVKRGDALEIIARKAGVTISQLKLFNALPNDTIRIGQILRIPTSEELTALLPPPAAPVAPLVPKAATPHVESKKSRKSTQKAPLEPEIDHEAEATLLQVFLDRENFTSGPIDGNQGAPFLMVLAIYRSIHPDLETPEALRAKAVASVVTPFTHYTLKRSDFRFIAPPKAEAKPLPTLPKTKGAKTAVAAKAPPLPPPTYEELTAATYSAYRTPWEFIAERFHCDESFLHSLNPKVKNTPTVDTDFKVPNVAPFELEKCFDAPLRPASYPDKPVTAAIIEFSRLEIRQCGQIVAVMPLARARPDLRGRGTWTILDATPGPQLATRQESKVAPKTTEAVEPATSPEAAVPTPVPARPLDKDQIIAAGPRNPVGIYWINLAKANSTTPLPYGLHGTSIPNRMKTQASIGGLRLTNWDIARAVRLLPEGTPLAWK